MTPRHIVAIGGSDAGISAALRVRELDPATEVTVVVADAYPNFSICGIPYYVSGEVTHWSQPRPPHRRRPGRHRHACADRHPRHPHQRRRPRPRRPRPRRQPHSQLTYDALIVGTGAVSARPPITGLTGPDALGAADGVHLLHSMGDTFAVMDVTAATATQPPPSSSAPATSAWKWPKPSPMRGIAVTQIEALPEVLPTVDAELGALGPRPNSNRHGVEVLTNTAVTAIQPHRSRRTDRHRHPSRRNTYPSHVDFVLVVVGVRPDTELAADAGAELGVKGAIAVDDAMRTNLPDVFAAGDCVHTHHRLLGTDVAAAGHHRAQAGPRRRRERHRRRRSLRRQPRHPGRQGLRPRRRPHRPARTRSRGRTTRLATGQHHHPAPTTTRPTTPAPPRYTSASPATTTTGRLLGAQLIGHRSAEVAKRVDTYAAALFHDMTVDAPQRPRPVLHPTTGLPLGRHPNGRTGLGPPAPTRRSPLDLGCRCPALVRADRPTSS